MAEQTWEPVTGKRDGIPLTWLPYEAYQVQGGTMRCGRCERLWDKHDDVACLLLGARKPYAQLKEEREDKWHARLEATMDAEDRLMRRHRSELGDLLTEELQKRGLE